MSFVKTILATSLIAISTTALAEAANSKPQSHTREHILLADSKLKAKTLKQRPGVGGPIQFKQKEDRRPDYIIEPVFSSDAWQGFPGTGFCKKNPGGGAATQIAFRVKNIGQKSTVPTKVYVGFVGKSGPNQDYLINIPPLGAGNTFTKQMNIPASAYPNSDHGFAWFNIISDAHTQVIESQELNNSKTGKCSLPAT